MFRQWGGGHGRRSDETGRKTGGQDGARDAYDRPACAVLPLAGWRRSGLGGRCGGFARRIGLSTRSAAVAVRLSADRRHQRAGRRVAGGPVAFMVRRLRAGGADLRIHHRGGRHGDARQALRRHGLRIHQSQHGGLFADRDPGRPVGLLPSGVLPGPVQISCRRLRQDDGLLRGPVLCRKCDALRLLLRLALATGRFSQMGASDARPAAQCSWNIADAARQRLADFHDEPGRCRCGRGVQRRHHGGGP